MKDIKVLGIDLAKNVFQLHGTDARGKCVLTRRLTREKLLEFIANLKPCLIGLEACLGAHYWARTFEGMGHAVRIMAPQFVKPYVMADKNDSNDASGIAEAVTRPKMKFVAVKTIEQQDVLAMHRARELVMKQRTASINQIRGLLVEYGVVIPKGAWKMKMLLTILENNSPKLTERSIAIFKRLYDPLKNWDQEIKFYDEEIEKIANQNVICKEIMKIEGVGPITASAIVATVGDAKTFKNGRQMAAWLGLVPKQHSSGNKIRLSGITKRGDSYVRKLLVQGARSAVNHCKNKTDRKSIWLLGKRNLLGYNKAAVAAANKNARIIWALMVTGESYRQSKAA